MRQSRPCRREDEGLRLATICVHQTSRPTCKCHIIEAFEKVDLVEILAPGNRKGILVPESKVGPQLTHHIH